MFRVLKFSESLKLSCEHFIYFLLELNSEDGKSSGQLRRILLQQNSHGRKHRAFYNTNRVFIGDICSKN